jgi:hypothetical protein
MGATCFVYLLLLGAQAGESLAPWASNRHPTDVAKTHIQEIMSAPAKYTVIQGGTMDGRNCRSPQGVWQPFHQTWESNRSVRLENLGQNDLVNPWLSNGRDDFRNVDDIVTRAIEPRMSEAERARALWWQEVQHRFHFEGDNNELLDPVKVFNVYGHNTCGNDSISLAGLWHRTGLRVAPARLVGHCVSQVFYDGAWHLMDGDMHSIYLLRDNQTVAGEQDLVRDHDLIRRTHTQGILQPERRSGDEWESSIYVFEGEVTGDRNFRGDTSMNMTLRPGEAIEWRWGHLNPVKYHGTQAPQYPDRICNGLWEYRPDLTNTAWRKGATAALAIQQARDGLAAEDGKTGSVVWTMRSPYILVGGKLEFDGEGARFALSWDRRSWHDVANDLDPLFKPDGPARYVYFLRCELSGTAHLRALNITNDLQMAPLALPGMGVGSNTFVYTDQSAGQRRVRVTHHWVERSASRPPQAPPEPITPPDKGDVEGTGPSFQWKRPADPDGDAIADYHFELSDQSDMKWPLSMSFVKLISRTPDAGQARYTLPGPGLLNPDQEYFWRVRAQDDKGVWGPWSAKWRFTPRGPAPPSQVTFQLDAARSRGVLRWTPNPLGRKPVRYRVYASDEKGFSVSDQPYAVTVGVSQSLPAEFPANFVAWTTTTELDVVGTEVLLPRANKAFYRVVAEDGHGQRSGPSDYAAAPRPFFFSKPVTRASRGQRYRYRAAAIRSLGDLRTRVEGGKETMSFWDVERLIFRIQEGPEWLAIDEATGELTGTPDRVGKEPVVIAVTLKRPERRLDESALKWGIEKVVSSETISASTATQRFEIDVGP